MLFSEEPLTWRQVLAFVSVSVVTGANFKLVPYGPVVDSWYV